MKTILVTGGSGLVGNAIKDISNQYNYNFIYLNSKSCDLTNYEHTLDLFKKNRPDIIIHLAANVGGLYKNMNYRAQMFEDNLLINLNVLKSAKILGVKRLIACLSTCVFPDGLLSLNEKVLHDGIPHYSNEGYAYAKRMLEVQCRIYREQFGLNYTCIIPTNIYGNDDNYNLDDSHVIPGLIHRCYLAKQKGIPFVIKGTGKPLRQFIHSRDLAKIIIELLEIETNIVIISPTQEYSIKQAAEIIAKRFEYNNIEFDHTFSDGQFSKTADNQKLMELLPNFRFTDLTSGINETVDYFITNYQLIRK